VVVVSWFLILDRSRGLEDEDAKFKAYLEANGHRCHFGGSLVEKIKTTVYKMDSRR